MNKLRFFSIILVILSVVGSVVIYRMKVDLGHNNNPFKKEALAAPQVCPPLCGNPYCVTATEDTYADETTPGTNYGTAQQVRIGNWYVPPYSMYFYLGYFKFDTSAFPPSYIKATLTLYQGASAPAAGPTDVHLHRVTSSWSESGLTWNNKPTYDLTDWGTQQVGDSFSNGQSVSWDITSLLQSNSIPNGFVVREGRYTTSCTSMGNDWPQCMRAGASRAGYMNSREAASNQPQICFEMSQSSSSAPSCSLHSRGDATCDGVIDSIDYAQWRVAYTNVGTTIYPRANMDFNNDNSIDLVDFEIWRVNRYNPPVTSSSSSSSSSTPPSTSSSSSSAPSSSSSSSARYMSFVNSTTGLTCEEICQDRVEASCVSIGTDTAGTNGKYWNRGMIGCNGDWQGDCNTQMLTAYSPGMCPATAPRYNAEWTYCRCGPVITWTPPPSCGGSCFTQDMTVSTPRGQMKIADVKKGDSVYSFNPETKGYETDTVVRTYKRTNDGYYKITLSDGRLLEVTAEHPILTEAYVFKKVKELHEGMRIVSYINSSTTVDTIASIAFVPGSKTVYNLETAKNHTFIVEDVVVHNKAVIDVMCPVYETE